MCLRQQKSKDHCYNHIGSHSEGSEHYGMYHLHWLRCLKKTDDMLIVPAVKAKTIVVNIYSLFIYYLEGYEKKKP
jgi:hypothetical protein